MSTVHKRSTFGSAVIYEDPAAALDWLEKAFGFHRSMVIVDDRGRIAHAEMEYGDGYLMVGSKWNDVTEPPSGVGGKNTQNGRPSASQYSEAARKTSIALWKSCLWPAAKRSPFSKMRTYPVFVGSHSRSVKQSFSASQL